MKLVPLKEKIVVKPIEAETKTKGGIYIPDTAKEKTNQGEVIAVWSEKDSPVKVGDRVLYESYAGTEVTVDDEKNLILNIKEVLAVVK